MPWEKIIDGILGGGGVHPALFLMALLAIAWLVLDKAKCEKQRRDEFNTIYEKRLEEQGRVLVALERATNSMVALTAAVEGRDQTTNDLVRGFGELTNQNSASRANFKDQADRLERKLEDISRLLQGK